MRKIRAEISRGGEVSIEFIGFKGEECADERERLRKVMSDFGIMLEPIKIKKKTVQQMAREVVLSEETTPSEKIKM
jgi:hypothetical protein